MPPHRARAKSNFIRLHPRRAQNDLGFSHRRGTRGLMIQCLHRAVRALLTVCAAGLLSGCTLSDALRNDPISSVQASAGTPSRKPIVAIVTDREPDASKPLGF